jgi:hypothetical protein
MFTLAMILSILHHDISDTVKYLACLLFLFMLQISYLPAVCLAPCILLPSAQLRSVPAV